MEGGELSLGIKNPETNKTCTTKALEEQQRQKVQDLPQTRIPTLGKGDRMNMRMMIVLMMMMIMVGQMMMMMVLYRARRQQILQKSRSDIIL